MATPPAPVIAPSKDLTIAYWLWLVLGFLGVHKFYLGRIGMGVLYIFTGALFSIGWLVDLFTLPKQVQAANARLAEQ